MSINMWSTTIHSQVLGTLVRIKKTPIDKQFMSQFESMPEKYAVATKFLETLVAVVKVKEPKPFLEYLWKQRFEHLTRTLEIKSANESKVEFCPKDKNAKEEMNEKLRSVQFDVVVKELVKEFDKIPLGTRGIWLGNFVEFVLYEVVLEDFVGAFLEDCFVSK